MSDRNDPSAFTLLNAVTGTGAGSGVPFGSEGARVYVYSAAGSSATVLIQGSLDNSVWFTLATITNPAASPAGECWKGTSWPFIRCNVTARASGTITAKAQALNEDPGAWAPEVGAVAGSAPTYGLLKYSWTNAQIVAAGSGVGPLNVAIGSVPAKSVISKTHLIVDTQATLAAGGLTASLGVTATAYVDLIVASDIKATAGTIYGDAANEKGATNLGHLYAAAARPLVLQILAAAGNLADVTGSTGTVYVEYVTYP
jgi:hypothetical protein